MPCMPTCMNMCDNNTDDPIEHIEHPDAGQILPHEPPEHLIETITDEAEPKIDAIIDTVTPMVTEKVDNPDDAETLITDVIVPIVTDGVIDVTVPEVIDSIIEPAAPEGGEEVEGGDDEVDAPDGQEEPIVPDGGEDTETIVPDDQAEI